MTSKMSDDHLRIVKTETGHKGFQQAINAISDPSSRNEKSTPDKE